MFNTLISRYISNLSTFSFSSMDFHLRNLYHYHDSPNPSPQQSPFKLPPYEILDHFHIHIHTLQIAMIAIACLVTTVMLLVTIFISLRSYQNSSRRRHNLNHNYVTRNTPILFDVHGYRDSLNSDNNNNNNNDGDDGERNIVIDHPIWFIRTIGLQQSVIDSITVFKYRKNEGVIDGTECSVCLGEFEHEESLKLLPKCNHAFHITCIDTWLRSHKNCPLCRAPVFNDVVAEVSVTVNDGESQNQENFDDVVVAGLGSHDVGEFESVGDAGYSGEKKHVKRSFSMDSSFASMISGKHDGSGSGSSSSIRRSFSQNGKFVFCNCRHCKSKSSTLPL